MNGYDLNLSTPLLYQHQQSQCHGYSSLSPRSSVILPKRHRHSTWQHRFTHYFTYSNLIIILLSIGLAISHATEMLTRKFIATNMFNYRWFLIQSISILSCFITLPFIIIRYPNIQFNCLTFATIRTLAFLSLLDIIHSFCIILASGVLPGPMSVVLPLAIVPLTLLFRFLGGSLPTPTTTFQPHPTRRCKSCYLIGSILVIGAVCMSFLPQILSFHPCASGGRTRGETVANIVIILIGVVPAAASMVYKQTWLTTHSIDMYLLSFIQSLFSIIFGFLLSPLIIELQFISNRHMAMISSTRSTTSPAPHHERLPALIDVDGVNIGSTSTSDTVSRNIITNFGRGLMCIITGTSSEWGDVCDDQRIQLIITVILFLGSMIISQVFIMMLLSRLSKETWINHVMALSTLLTISLFYVPQIQNLLPYSDNDTCLSFDWFVILGAIFAVVGVIISNMQTPTQSREINIWARLEELEHEEEMELRIHQQAHMNGQHSRNPNP